jgi:hypothetical protein
MVKTLTDRFVAGVPLADRQTNIFDTKAQGLSLRVGARTKVWYFVYRDGNASRWLRLGRYPALGLAEARQLVHVERAKLDRPPSPPAHATLSLDSIEQVAHALAAIVIRTLRQELARYGQDAH